MIQPPTSRARFRWAALIGAAAWSVAACGGSSVINSGLGPNSGNGTVKGSGVETKISIDVSTFERVSTTANFDVKISPGTSESVSITVDDNLVDKVEVTVTDGVLRFGLKPGVSVRKAKLIGSVTVPALAGASAKGSSAITVVGFTGDVLDLAAEDASKTTVTNLAAQQVNITASGAGLIKAAGSAGQVRIKNSGVSVVEAKLTGVGDVEVNANGASKTTLTSAKTVSGQLGGVGILTVPAPADVSMSTSKTSTIRRSGNH